MRDSENGRMALRERVLQTLRAEPLIGAHFHPSELEVDEEGVVTIAGEVGEVKAKKRVLRRVAALEGVSGIIDRLHVIPATPMGDGEIRAELRRLYTLEPAFASYAIREVRGITVDGGFRPHYRCVLGDPAIADGVIDIEVSDAIVTLSGHVPGLASKRLAGVMAWWVPGVRDVFDGIEVRPPEEDAPIRLEEAIRVVLEADPVIDASQVRVGVRADGSGAVVRLTGALPSDEQREMAERDCWCVLGVDEVINEIDVAP